MGNCQNLSSKDSDEEDDTYLEYFPSCSLIFSRHVSMTTQNYVHIPEISRSVLNLPTDGVCIFCVKIRHFYSLQLCEKRT